eukprot:13586087-Ditylum_brightwellii.AAC.1
MNYFAIKHDFSSETGQISNTTNNQKAAQGAKKASSNTAAWETMTFDEFCNISENVKNSFHQEQKILKDTNEELQRIKINLDKEHDFIKHVSARCLNDIINFDVRGTPMTAKRSTLRIFMHSQLDRQFDNSTWPEPRTNLPSIKEWSCYEQVVDWAKHKAEIPDEVA